MKISFFRRFILLYAAIMAAALLVSEFFITTTLRDNHLEDLRHNLRSQIELISDSIFFNKKNLDTLCVSIKNRTGARATIIAASGAVIGDSDSLSAQMENHLQRTEIAQAALYGEGSFIRKSGTLHADFLYLSKKIINQNGHEGYLRLAVPLDRIDSYISSMRLRMTLIISGALIAMWLFALWRTEHLRKLVADIKDFSSTLSDSGADRRLYLNSDDEFGAIAANLTAMAERFKALLRASIEERDRLNTILESIPEGLLLIDIRGIITLSNHAAASILNTDQLIGIHYMDIFRNNELASLLAKVRQIQAQESAEITLARDPERYFNIVVSPLFYKERELAGFVLVLHDITRLQKLERIRKDFVANISHEIKTPITAIKGFAETLLDGAIHEKDNAVRFLCTIKQNSERINNLVDDLLTLSSIELGVIHITKTPVAINDLLEQVHLLLIAKADEKHIELAVSKSSENITILADRDRLIQILANLVDNAIKFTEHGIVTFGIKELSGQPCLFVKDTGIGIAEKHISRLGERFYRVDAARSRNMGGTGLGLAIVKHLVKAHGWELSINSLPDKGTSVIIHLT